MKAVNLTGTPRQESGSKSAKDLRNEGMVPCVIYGGDDTVMFSVHKNELNPIIYTGDFFKVLVSVDGKEHETIVKDMQFHPVTDDVLHMDFQELVAGRKVKTSIPVRLKGSAAGVRVGGVLQHKLLRLNVRIKPEDMVESLFVDISALGLGDSVKVSDIESGDIEVLDSPSIPVASVISPRALRSAQAKAGAEGTEDAAEEGEEG